MDSRIAIILVNYGGSKDTIECAVSLRPALQKAGRRLVIVDNASPDDSIQQLGEWGASWCAGHGLSFRIVDDQSSPSTEQVVVVRSRANGGFASGNNIAIRHLRVSGMPDFVWLLNNDTVVEASTVDTLLRFASKAGTAIIGCTIADFHHPSVVQCAGGSLYDSSTTTNRPALIGQAVANVVTAPQPALSFICGAAMLLPRKIIDEVGLLNEDYFLFYEELDYARRAHSKGYGLAWCRDAVIYHKGGAATGGGPHAPKKSRLAEYHANLSCLKYTRRYEKAFARTAATRFVLKVTHHLAHRQWHLFSPLARAYVHYFILRK
jgi:GT2 family glycosyltransferase